MKIRQTKDYELVAKLNQPVQNVHAELYPEKFMPYSFEHVKDFFEEIIHNPEYVFLILKDDDEYLGYAWIEIKKIPENTFKKARESIYVHQISVVNALRKRGYGSKLMEAVYEIAKKNQIKLIELDYWIDNVLAKEFYQKLGFAKSREYVYKEL